MDEGEKLFRPGRKNPIVQARHAPSILFLMRVRDEAHRFGVSKHRARRNKSTLASELDTLHGVGQKRKQLLLKTFGSIERIRQATKKQLEAVDGIGPALARSIHVQLNKQP